MYLRALYGFHLVYFIAFATTMFLPRYFGDLGMSDSQIGILMSLPAVASVFTQPLFGALSDRVRYKKIIVIALLAALAVVSFVMDRMTGFVGFLIGMTLISILQSPINPLYATISLEYTREIGKAYGPIRLMGTIGYQLGALGIGMVLSASLQGLYRIIGLVFTVSCAIACFLPPVRGHQHGRAKVSVAVLFRDRHIVLLIAMVLIGAITSQFYMSFFSKHLGDLGASNAMTGVMIVITVSMEIPFLLFADKLARKTSIWNWLLIGFALNAVRWIGLSLIRSVPLLMATELLGVSVMACFEFFPAVYINRRVPDELKGTAQTAVMVASFGISKIIGGLLGGFVSDRVGIPAVFGFNGVLLLVGIAVFWRPTRRLIAEEPVDS